MSEESKALESLNELKELVKTGSKEGRRAVEVAAKEIVDICVKQDHIEYIQYSMKTMLETDLSVFDNVVIETIFKEIISFRQEIREVIGDLFANPENYRS